MSETGLRARSVPEIRARLAGFSSREARARGRAYRPAPSDVFIATYPKCGTTLLQQVVHGLRTGGDMDFPEITAAVPWLELAHDLGLDPGAPQAAPPKAFKTHLTWEEVPKGGRYIYVLRDPRDVLVSFFHFFEGWFFEPGSIDLRTFALEFFVSGSGAGRYWEHLVSWWPALGAQNTLALAFEDVIADLPGAVATVAGFIGVPPEPERLRVATAQASIDFMRAHGARFDDHLVRRARNPACGLPADAASTKVRAGRAGDHDGRLDDDVQGALEARWREVVAPVTGLATYADLRARIRAARPWTSTPGETAS